MEVTRSFYAAVDFAYDESTDVASASGDKGDQTSETPVQAKEQGTELGEGKTSSKGESHDARYICPPDLILPPTILLPRSDRQAAIIERTAVFIARNSTQMEIVLKAKQASNPQFQFLNYDSDLNPFYKELVKLIKSGRYIPKIRQAAETNVFGPGSGQLDASHNNRSVGDDNYELKLPKVDISDTSYASLIERFKKSAAEKLAAANEIPATPISADSPSIVVPSPPPTSPPHSPQDISNNNDASSPATDLPLVSQSDDAPVEVEAPETVTTEPESTTDAAAVAPPSTAEYEQCYQEYYKQYYAYYFVHLARMHFGTMYSTAELPAEESALIVQEAAKAAATAASAAINAVHQSRLASSQPMLAAGQQYIPPTSEQRVIIDKMAEYVIRNGDEFEEVVKKTKKGDPRLAFLQPDHIFHDYYQKKKAELSGKSKSESKTDKKHVALLQTPKSPLPEDVKSQNNDKLKPPKNPDALQNSGQIEKPRKKSAAISFRLSKSSSANKLKSTEPQATLPNPEAPKSLESPKIHPSASCNLLPGMQSYSSGSSDEDGSPPPSPASSPPRVREEQPPTNQPSPDRQISNPVFGPAPSSEAPSNGKHFAPAKPVPTAKFSVEETYSQHTSAIYEERSRKSMEDMELASSTEALTISQPVLTEPQMVQAPNESAIRYCPLPDISAKPLTYKSSVCVRKTDPTPEVLLPAPQPDPTQSLKVVDLNVAAPSEKSKSSDSTSTTQKLHTKKPKVREALPEKTSNNVDFDTHSYDNSEELARLQLERRKRAALLVARLKQSKDTSASTVYTSPQQHNQSPLASTNWEDREEERDAMKLLLPSTATAIPPPAPTSVPAAVANAVVAQLRLQRQKAIAAEAEIPEKKKRKEHKRKRSPPSAYLESSKRYSESPPLESLEADYDDHRSYDVELPWPKIASSASPTSTSSKRHKKHSKHDSSSRHKRNKHRS